MKNEQLTEKLSPIIHAIGLECWGVEFSPSQGHSLIRIYIDVSDRSITLDDCEAVSREISAMFDREAPVVGHYTLEVSSPGLDRPLYTPEHFERFIGQEVTLACTLPVSGRRRFQGGILGVEGTTIILEQDKSRVEIPHHFIQKARLVPVFSRSGKNNTKKLKN